jgi:tetratricopeptide (TPR) repeat protein
LSYAANQGIVILHYLRLAFWPKGLCLDYRWPIVKDWGKLAMPVLAVLAMLAVTVWGIIRNKSWSYPAAWFFGVLAVTSSFVPVADLVFEHRMYLPLAGLAVLAVTGGYVLLERWSARKLGVILAAAVIIVLGLATFERNSDYRSAESIWRTVLDVTPENPRAHNSLGSVLRAQGRVDEAISCFRQALRLKPDYASAYNNLGIALQSVGNSNEAVICIQRSLQIDPDYADGYYNLGKMFQLLGKLDDAAGNYRRAIQLNPGLIKAYNNLGIVLSEQGKADEAVKLFHQVLSMDPDYAEAYFNLGSVFQLQGNISEAENCYRRVLQINPNFAPAAESLRILYENKK